MSGPELRERIRRQPFVPLRLHLSDGRSFDIKHPELALITTHTVHLGIEPDEQNGVPDRVEYLSLRHLVSVEELSAPVSSE